MKKLLVFLCVALSAPLASLAADFEGTVKMKMSGPRGGPSGMTFSLAKDRSRIDVQANEGSPAMIFDQAKQEMTILLPEQKMYMVRPMPKPGELPSGAPRDEAKIEKTTQTEKILGYECVKYVATSEEGVTEVWVTDQLGTFMGLGGGNPMGGPGGGRGRRGGMPQSWANALHGQEAFPLRVISKNPSGNETFRMEATAVEKTSLPPSTFTAPSDFQKLDMSMMGGGMPGMPGMPGKR